MDTNKLSLKDEMSLMGGAIEAGRICGVKHAIYHFLKESGNAGLGFGEIVSALSKYYMVQMRAKCMYSAVQYALKRNNKLFKKRKNLWYANLDL